MGSIYYKFFSLSLYVFLYFYEGVLKKFVQAIEHCVTFILAHFILCILILLFRVVVLPLSTTSWCVLAADWSVVSSCFPAVSMLAVLFITFV